MDRVAADLKKPQVSPETVKQQKQVLSELDRLVNLAESLPPPRRGQPTGPSKQLGSPPADPANKAPNSGSQPSNSSADQRNSTPTGKTPAEQRRVLIRQVWGHLPPSLQRRVLTGTNEKPVPKYQRLIRKYFEVLAETSHRSPTDGSRMKDRQ